MRLSERYNRVNLVISFLILLITGIIYYVVIHFILTDKLDRDLAVEENEIRQYTKTFQKLPLPASYLDQQVTYKRLQRGEHRIRDFGYTTYYNPKEKETEPGRSLVTTVTLKDQVYVVTITKSRVEAEDLVRIILSITLGVTIVLLLLLILINRFLLNRLWKPFYTILNRMKDFEVSRMDTIGQEFTKIDEFNELNTSVNAMAIRVHQDYSELKSFTDNASHEMMTPLAVINSKLDSLLQTESFTPQQGALLTDIYQATGRLSRLHQSLLLLARIENNMIADIQDIDMKAMVENKIRQFEELFDKDQLKIHTQLSPVLIKMSRYLVDILLNNLISNAIRHNYEGGRVELMLNEKSMTVTNTGKATKLDERHFDRFFKSSDSEGMGLGLAITKQVCNLYDFKLDYVFDGTCHHFTIHFTS